MEAAQEVSNALTPMSDEEAAFMVEHHEVVRGFLAEGSMAVGVGGSMVSKHLSDVETILKDLEKLHVETFQQHGKLQGAKFFAERKLLLSQLDKGLGPLVRKGVGIPDHPKLKSAMGISSRSLVHHWKKSGCFRRDTRLCDAHTRCCAGEPIYESWRFRRYWFRRIGLSVKGEGNVPSWNCCGL